MIHNGKQRPPEAAPLKRKTRTVARAIRRR
jgi:hypothetical protein